MPQQKQQEQQQHAAAEAASTNKQKFGLSCAPRHALESAPPQREDRPHFFVLFVRDREEHQK